MVTAGENDRVAPQTAPAPAAATIEVPASTSNIGPGFDCLGIALSLSNRVTVERRRGEPGGTPGEYPRHPMVRASAARYFEVAGRMPFEFGWSIAGDVPPTRGLGSSVTLRHGILAGLNQLCGDPLAREAIFETCAAEEGHPDNAGPAAFGGFFVGNANGRWFRFDVDPRLRFVLLIPDFKVQTDRARAALPATVPFGDAVHNLGRAAAITAAFASGRYESLRECFDDRLHQRQRARLVPGLFEVIDAGTRAGALGGFLSGSGPTIACVVWEADPDAVAAAMLAAWPGPAAARLSVVSADNAGARTV